MNVIDSCVFHDWKRMEQLAPYMSAGWQATLMRPGNPLGPNECRAMQLYRHPFGTYEEAMYPPDGPAGSDRDLTTAHLLAGEQRERVVLGYGQGGLQATAFTNPNAAQILTRALNDWTLEHWLEPDPRFHGLILVSTAIPQEAAAEIRRHGANPRFVGVALGTNGLDRPFGQSAYHPIYEAASEMGLPLVLQVGCDTGTSLMVPPIAGGIASTYAETEIWAAQPLMIHLSSFLFDGVFDLYPNLRLLLVGGGLTWYPPFAWRLDGAWNHIHSEAPLMQALPSEYLRKHVRVSTAGMETAIDAERLQAILSGVPFMEETLVYGSGYPERGWTEPDAALERLPESWRSRVLHQNAADFFRFPAASDTTGSPRTAAVPG